MIHCIVLFSASNSFNEEFFEFNSSDLWYNVLYANELVIYLGIFYGLSSADF